MEIGETASFTTDTQQGAVSVNGKIQTFHIDLSTPNLLRLNRSCDRGAATQCRDR
jgi:hypothetical protein